MLAVRTPGAPQATRKCCATCDSAFPIAGQGRLLRSRSISGLFSRSFYSGLQLPCLRFAVAVTGHHARLGSRLLARLYRGRHLRRQSSTHLHGATRTDPCERNSRTRLPPWVSDGGALIAAHRMRSSVCDTVCPVLCPASSATAPRLPDADRRLLPNGRSRDLPVPAQGASAHARVSDHAGPSGRSRLSCPSVLPSARTTASAPGIRFLSRLNGWPMRSPADASPPSLRTTTHGSGPVWVATPSLQRTRTSYSLPVSRRTIRKPSQSRKISD
jgi:hypothetical protein